MILCAVRWYLRYSLSFRDVEELLNERGLEADHTSGGGAVWYPPLDALSAHQRASETLRLACKIAPICLIPSIHYSSSIPQTPDFVMTRTTNASATPGT